MGESIAPSKTCLTCKYYLGDKVVEIERGLEGDHIVFCKKFFNGIPEKILSGNKRCKHSLRAL